MKTYHIAYKLCLLVCLFFNCTVPKEDTENTEEEDCSTTLPWSGDTDKFKINASKGIQLNDSQKKAGVAYLSTPLSTICDQQWEFRFTLKFNPSKNNFARFYLTATSENLTEPLEGYFIQLGSETDNISLCRESEDESTSLIAGRECMQGDNSPDIQVKVECDAEGNWSLWTRRADEKEYVFEGKAHDSTIQESVCCGLVCIYTASRCKDFNFRDIHIKKGVESSSKDDKPSTEEPKPDEPNLPPDLPDEVRNLLLFNEVMYFNKDGGTEYVEFYNPSDKSVRVDQLYLGKLHEDGTYMSKTILCNENKPIDVAPHGYICFAHSIKNLMDTHHVEAKSLIEIHNFPPLNNSAGILVLTTINGKLIDKCRFGNAQQSAKRSSYKGVAIEKQAPNLPALNVNWRSCIHETGGTPGQKNSVVSN